MKISVAVVALAFALSACGAASQLASTVSSATKSAANDVNQIAAAVTSSGVQQAAQNLAVTAQTLACDLGDAASLMGAVAAAEDGGQVKSSDIAARDATSVYVASATVCNYLGGAVITAVPVTGK